LETLAEVGGVRLGRYDAALLTAESALLHAPGPTAVIGLTRLTAPLA